MQSRRPAGRVAELGSLGVTMSVLADFIIATEPEALEYSSSQTGISSSDLLEAKGITCVELSTLMALLDGKEYQEMPAVAPSALPLFPANE